MCQLAPKLGCWPLPWKSPTAPGRKRLKGDRRGHGVGSSTSRDSPAQPSPAARSACLAVRKLRMDFCFVGNPCLLNQSGLPTLRSMVSFWDTKRRTVGSDVWPVLALQITEVGGFPDIPPEQKTDPTGMLPALSCVQERLI